MINNLDELFLDADKDHLGWDAVGDQLIQPGPHLGAFSSMHWKDEHVVVLHCSRMHWKDEHDKK